MIFTPGGGQTVSMIVDFCKTGVQFVKLKAQFFALLITRHVGASEPRNVEINQPLRTLTIALVD
jgi:hypothetical protein